MTVDSLIEALLFSRTEPWSKDELARTLKKTPEEILTGLEELRARLTDRGIHLIETNTTYTLGTHPEASDILDAIYKEELSTSLSKASIETLSIIMYGDTVTRGKIDYIRGVNSGFIVRSLLIRGLIERQPYPGDRKRFIYIPTVALLAQLGVERVTALPDYARISKELSLAESGARQDEENNDIPQKES